LKLRQLCHHHHVDFPQEFVFKLFRWQQTAPATISFLLFYYFCSQQQQQQQQLQQETIPVFPVIVFSSSSSRYDALSTIVRHSATVHYDGSSFSCFFSV